MIRTRSPEEASFGALALALALGMALTAASFVAPAPASAQEEEAEQVQRQEGGTHEVVRGNTLWDLAAHFYGDPYRWPVIYEANREKIVDPHWIYPGQIFTIPGLEGEADREVMVVPGEEEAAGEETAGEETAARGPGPDRLPGTGPGNRTVFYNTTAAETEGTRIIGLPPTERFALNPDVFYSAPWLQPGGRDRVGSIGRVLGFTGAEQVRSNLQTAKPFDRLRVGIDGPRPDVGTLLQVFRVERDVPEVGSVVVPTGLLTVAELEGPGVVGVVSREFDRLRVGDLVRVAPRFPLALGVHPLETDLDGPVATIVAFGAVHEIYNLNDVALLDVGRMHGVAVGDEFVVVADHGPGWSGEVEGRVQIVGVQDRNASARILKLENPVFEVGVKLFPVRKMP